jgi:hypothetical protein
MVISSYKNTYLSILYNDFYEENTEFYTPNGLLKKGPTQTV